MPALQFADPLPIRSPARAVPDNKLLSTLPSEESQRICAHLTTVPLTFREVLHREGEPIRDVYFPGGGACSLTKTMNDGATAEIATIGNEGMIGLSVYFGEDRSMGHTIVQVGGGHAFRMPVDDFVAEMERHGAFYRRVIRYSQALMSQVMQATACNSLHSVEQRCCRWLLTTRDRVESDELKLTHDFLSMMLGVRRPTITIVVGGLQDAGLIVNRRSTIHIVDRRGLEAASCECYEAVKANFARLLPEMTGSMA